MLRSMTAFARIESQHDQGAIQWEIRSVNHRYLDVGVRLPEDLRRIEPKVRERVGARLERGKVDCTLRVLPAPADAGALSIDRDLAARVAGAARAVADLLPAAAPVSPVDVLRWPGVVQAPAPDPERIERLVLDGLDRALSDLAGMREREGARIEAMIRTRLDDLEVEIQDSRDTRDHPPITGREIGNELLEANVARLVDSDEPGDVASPESRPSRCFRSYRHRRPFQEPDHARPAGTAHRGSRLVKRMPRCPGFEP